MIGKKIVIVGSGTAAWISAFMFKSLGNCSHVTVIEPEINEPIGVGESTTPHFWFFLNGWCPYFNEKDFLKKTGSTLKYGVVHQNWAKPGSKFYNPIDSLGRINTNIFPTDFDYVRTYCIANGLDPALGYEKEMIKQRLAPFIETENGFTQKGNYAYHLNINNTLAYFKVVAEKIGIKLINGSVVDGKRDQILESVTLDNGQTVEGDLFIDCTGTKRILGNMFEKMETVSYENHLPLNSAIIYKKEQEKEIRTYTLAAATQDGWQWEIPVKDEIHAGYLYRKELVNEDELQNKFGGKILRFQSGRIKKFLNRNILSVGLSSGFVEPLEATSIHATLIQLNSFLSEYFRTDLDYRNTYIEDRYNSRMGKYWDSIRDWIRMHYFTQRKDSEFWKETSNLSISQELAEKMETFKFRMPRENDCIPGEIYQNSLTFHVLNGMELLNSGIAQKELDFYGLEETARNKYQEILKNDQNFIKNFVSHKYYLDNI